ncbi:hypothetical protein BASA62_005314 [Batrachochytrium salamandrivorans]|nr:hypothetical protein BASA62_005314 [Batrachochytrium salamandrivorans]
MKVSVLVAAAMVITSVSASGKGRPKGFLKKDGGMTGSESLEKLVMDDDPESEPPQKSPRRGARQGPSQSSLARKLRSSLPYSLLEDDSEPGPSQNSPKDEPRQGPSQSSLAHGSMPELSLDEVLVKFTYPSLLKKTRSAILSSPNYALHWSKFSDLNHEFRKHAPDFHKLMRREDEKWEDAASGYANETVKKNKKGRKSKKGKKNKKDDLNHEEIQKWIRENPAAIPGLQEIKTESISLKKCHFVIWEQLLDSKCPTEGLEYLSPAGMKRRGYFLDWYDEKGVDILEY